MRYLREFPSSFKKFDIPDIDIFLDFSHLRSKENQLNCQFVPVSDTSFLERNHSPCETLLFSLSFEIKLLQQTRKLGQSIYLFSFHQVINLSLSLQIGYG